MVLLFVLDVSGFSIGYPSASFVINVWNLMDLSSLSHPGIPAQSLQSSMREHETLHLAETKQHNNRNDPEIDSFMSRHSSGCGLGFLGAPVEA